MTTGVTIRDATAADAEAVAAIYNHYVLNSTVTFDVEPKSVDDRARWINERQPRHPVLVAEGDGAVRGYGVLSPWAARPAWAHTAEVGIYLLPESTGAGVGPRLLDSLIERGRTAGLHVLVAQIVTDNERSLAMVQRAGFVRVGTMIEVGRKFDRWLDVAIVQRTL